MSVERKTFKDKLEQANNVISDIESKADAPTEDGGQDVHWCPERVSQGVVITYTVITYAVSHA